jgi:hypothetical protein
VTGLIDACRFKYGRRDVVSGVFLKMLSPEQNTHEAGRSKNSGGRIAPAAIGASYRGLNFQRQRFPGLVTRQEFGLGRG